MFVKLTVLIFFLLSCTFLSAQTDSTHVSDEAEEIYGPFDMEEIVVTATRYKQKVANVTSAVSVIDAKEIEASNAVYVMDVIKTLPGVYVRRDAVYGRQSIEIRGLGMNGQQIQTLIDGRPEKMALFGCTVTQTLPLSNVERIEVIRGPESVLYGTDALGGVVNIITKKLITPGFETNMLLDYGTYNSFHSLIQHGGNTGLFDYFITADYKSSDGHRTNAGYFGKDFSAKTGYRFSNSWRAELSAKYFSDRAQDPGPADAPYIHQDKRDYTRYSWDFDVTGNWRKGEFLMNYYQNAGDHQFTMPSVPDYWHSKDNSYGFTLKGSYQIFELHRIKNTLSMGYDYRYEWAKTLEPWNSWARQNMPAKFMNIGTFNRNNHDLYAFNELTYRKIINTLGVRIHHDKNYSQVLLPQAGILYQITPNSSIRAKIGKGFRQPKFSELYLFPAHNELLYPEENWSYELGLYYRILKTAALTFNPFYMDIKKSIVTIPNDTPPPMQRNINAEGYYIKGVECGLDINPAKELTLTLYMTYMDIEDPEGTGHINRKGKPEFKYDAIINYSYHRLSMTLTAQYIAGLYDSNLFSNAQIEKVEDFFVAHLKVNYRINTLLKAFIGIENLFDKAYVQFPGYPMPGFSLFTGIKIGL
jgi:outer membrane cobalamin receptor